VINQLTDLPAVLDPRKYDEALRGTNRLREEVAPTLARAARDAGARRYIAQSVSFMVRPDGPGVADEDAPLWRDAPRPLTDAVASTVALEEATVGAEGVEGLVLRYGFFYGPGTAYAPDGHTAGEIARRRFPIVGGGQGLTSFVHVDDAADATLLALDHGTPGILNVTDDEPVAGATWIPAMARAMGAKPPRRLPLWLAKLLVGPMAIPLVRGMGNGNARAREQLGWTPAHPTYREGFPAVFGGGAG
jgi:nucleoside-diphosphate-sugar epimerase